MGKVRYNIGTIPNDLTVEGAVTAPNFYGVDIEIEGDLNIGGSSNIDTTFKESEAGGFSQQAQALTFDSNFFYLSTAGDGSPVVSSTGGAGEANTASNLAGDEGLFSTKVGVDLRFKSLTAGTNVTLSSDANAVTINSTGGGGAGGFYGITVAETDGDPTLTGINKINFNSDDFYVTQNAGNTDEAVINFRDVPRNRTVTGTFSTLAEWELSHNLNATPLLWSTFGDDGEAIIPDRVDVSDPNTAFFYFKPNCAGSVIVATGLSAEVSSGISGVTFTDQQGFSTSSDQLTFSTQFYLTSDSSGKPIVNVSAAQKVSATFPVALDEWEVPHNLGTPFVVWSVYDESGRAVIPDEADTSNPNTAFFYFTDTACAGTAVIVG